MDPATLAAGVSVLTKLVGFGLKAADAAQHAEFDKSDIEAIKALLETGAEATKFVRIPERDAASYQVALISRACGQALARHRSARELRKGPVQRVFSLEERARDADIRWRLTHAIDALPPLAEAPARADEVAALASLTRTPIATPYYRSLWAALSTSRPTLEGKGFEPLVDGNARGEFELHFLLAYWAGLSGPTGEAVENAQRQLRAYRKHRVRELFAADMASWGQRHVFGNVDEATWEKSPKGQTPFLPLEKMYVQPDARESTGGVKEDGANEPVITLVERLLARPDARVVVVSSDFGHGKSLTARTIASRLARQYRESPSPGVDQAFPVFIKCADDFVSDTFSLEPTMRRTWKRHAEDLGVSIASDDEAFGLPDPRQKVLFILDGLDEVVLGARSLDALFPSLLDAATDRRQFVVFSRPAVLPQRLHEKKGVHTIELLPLSRQSKSGDQIAEWLQRWNDLTDPAPRLSVEGIEARGLLELAKVPILLLMIAFTGGASDVSDGGSQRALLYESFFRRLARGKHEWDRDKNEPVFRAGEAMLRHLQDRGELGPTAEAADAMLWLMSRVAWESQRLAWQRPPANLANMPARPLTRVVVERVLAAEAPHLERETAATIQIGLLLSLQADLRANDDHILFGHQSFREYLVGRYWSDRLYVIVTSSQLEWAERTSHLLGARLLAQEDKSFDFLMELVNVAAPPTAAPRALAWTARERETLVSWAQHVFEDESQGFGGRATSVRDDQRAILREAALAIGSAARESPGLRAKDDVTLRTLVAWFWMIDARARVIAPGFHGAGSLLRGVSLFAAELTGCDLRSANLAGAFLRQTTLREANLAEAVLFGARLHEADLSGANLERAVLDAVTLSSATLDRACLARAYGLDASLAFASCRGTDFSGARLPRADFSQADLSGANLRGADLSDARFARADLTGAVLRSANLSRADFSDADLSGVDLTDAETMGARFDGAIF